MYFTAQILGLIGIVIWAISFLLKKKKDILLIQAIANLIYTIEYLLLKAFTASLMNICSFLRLIIYYLFDIKGKKVPKYVLLIFITIILMVGVFTYTNIFNLIPIIIALLYTYALWQDNLFKARIIHIVCAFVWIYYNINVLAHVGIIGNILEIITNGWMIMKSKK